MRFVCPYHSWSYGLDGALLSVPETHNFNCLVKADRGLVPVRCETWRGFVFLNLDQNARSLAETLAPLVEQTAGLPRSEERRVGKECVSTCRSRWSNYHSNKNNVKSREQIYTK